MTGRTSPPPNTPVACAGQLLIYQTEDGRIKIEAHLQVEAAICRNFRQVRAEGTRQVARDVPQQPGHDALGGLPRQECGRDTLSHLGYAALARVYRQELCAPLSFVVVIRYAPNPIFGQLIMHSQCHRTANTAPAIYASVIRL